MTMEKMYHPDNKQYCIMLNEGYINFSKWLIGLSTGVILFSVSEFRGNFPYELKPILFTGIGYLFISILAGTFYVGFKLEFAGYDIQVQENTHRMKLYENKSLTESFTIQGKEMTVAELIQNYIDVINAIERKMKVIDRLIVIASYTQIPFFYAGILVITYLFWWNTFVGL